MSALPVWCPEISFLVVMAGLFLTRPPNYWWVTGAPPRWEIVNEKMYMGRARITPASISASLAKQNRLPNRWAEHAPWSCELADAWAWPKFWNANHWQSPGAVYHRLPLLAQSLIPQKKIWCGKREQLSSHMPAQLSSPHAEHESTLVLMPEHNYLLVSKTVLIWKQPGTTPPLIELPQMESP